MSAVLPVKIASGELDRMVSGTDFIGPAIGGTGQVTYAQGDLLQGNGTTGLDKLTIGTNGQVLTSNGTSAGWANVSSNNVALTNDESGALIVGNALYSDAAGGCKKAKADAAGTSKVVGLALTATAASGSTTVQVSGPVTLTTAQWDAVAGTTGGLVFNTIYYLSPTTAGSITGTPPDTTGQRLVAIGRALSTTVLELGITNPIGL